jgi:hypothetical protein
MTTATNLASGVTQETGSGACNPALVTNRGATFAISL